MEFSPLLTRRYDIEDNHKLAVAEANGVYKQARKALTSMQPAARCSSRNSPNPLQKNPPPGGGANVAKQTPPTSSAPPAGSFFDESALNYV